MAVHDGIEGIRPRPIITKLPVYVATTGNIADLAAGAPDTVDGIPVYVTARVLVKNQSITGEVGIYVVKTPGTGSNGTWVRAQDWLDGEKDYILGGVHIYVQAGATQGNKTYTMTTTAGAPGFPTIGTTGLVFEELSPTSVETINNFLPTIQNTTAKVATFTGVIGEMHLVDLSGGSFTCDLPAIADGQGRIAFYITDTNGQLTLDPNGAETVEGKTTIKVAQGTNTIENDGTEWKVVQKTGRLNTRLDPAQITADTNDYSPTDWGRDVTHLYLDTDADRTITGFAEDGFVGMDSVIVVNDGSNNILISHDNSASTAANRVLIADNSDVVLGPGGIATLLRDGTVDQWRLIPGRSTLVADSTETEVLDRSGADFANEADYAAAVAVATARTTSLDCRLLRNVTFIVEVTTVGSMSNIMVAPRSSAKASPAVATAADWGRMNRTAAVDTGTGIDTSQPLEEKIPITGVGRYVISLPVTNRHVSAVVWADGTGGRGKIYMYREP